MIPWTKDRVEWMAALIQELGNWPAVALRMGIEESTARKAATKFGLREPRNPQWQVKWTDERLARLKARYEVEKDWNALAAEFECSVGAVIAACRRYVKPTPARPAAPPPPPSLLERDPVHTLPVLLSLEGWEPPPAVRVIPPARYCQWPDYACSGGLWRGSYCEYHYRVCYNRVEEEGKDLAPWVPNRAGSGAGIGFL
jgi:hypothetical protein